MLQIRSCLIVVCTLKGFSFQLRVSLSRMWQIKLQSFQLFNTVSHRFSTNASRMLSLLT